MKKKWMHAIFLKRKNRSCKAKFARIASRWLS